MDKYIKVETFKRKLIDEKSFFPAIVARALEEMPVADVVEVVRCKDCKFYKQFDKVEDFDGLCDIHCIGIDKEFYCQYGKRK